MKPIAPVALVALFVTLAACSDGEDIELASTKYAATLCTKVDACNIPKDDPNETQEQCRSRIETSFRNERSGATKSACSKEENDACRRAIEAEECSDFTYKLFVEKKLPAACDGC